MIVAFVGVAALFFAGPTVSVDDHIRPVQLPEDLDSYLAASEAQVANIRPNTEKTIIWVDPAQKNKTPVSIIYLHGFSATRRETVPLADNLAQALGANLFYTRLTGHGRDGEALAQATVNDWLNDAVEALAIGRQIGERVIIVGTSTGGTLATWLAVQPEQDDVAALVLLSPNFGLQDPKSELMLWPWAEVIVPLIGGASREREPFNAQDAQYWTTRYPTVALLPVMGLVKLSREIEAQQVSQPVFIAYSPADSRVNPEKTVAFYGQLGSEVKQLVAVEETEDPFNHVIVGDIRSPNNNQYLTQLILAFLRPLLAD